MSGERGGRRLVTHCYFKKRKLIDIGLRYGIQRIWKLHSGRFLRTLDEKIGAPSSVNQLDQKYIHTLVCTRAILRHFSPSVFTDCIVELPRANEIVRWGKWKCTIIPHPLDSIMPVEHCFVPSPSGEGWTGLPIWLKQSSGFGIVSSPLLMARGGRASSYNLKADGVRQISFCLFHKCFILGYE